MDYIKLKYIEVKINLIVLIKIILLKYFFEYSILT